jgi:hypothetical protein
MNKNKPRFAVFALALMMPTPGIMSVANNPSQQPLPQEGEALLIIIL